MTRNYTWYTLIPMEITAYSPSCYRLQARSIDILINPPANSTGFPPPRITPDLVLTTTPGEHLDTSRFEEAMLIDRPGEYEFHGAVIRGFRTGKLSTSYLISVEEMTVSYLGELSQLLGDETLEEVSDCHLIFIPVGGGEVLDGKQAASLISQISPRVVIPTHFALSGAKGSSYDDPEKFFRELGAKPTPDSRYKLSRRELPEELRGLLYDEERKGPIRREIAELTRLAQKRWANIQARLSAGTSQPEQAVARTRPAMRVLLAS